MISERVLSTIIKNLSQQHLELEPTAETHLPEAEPGRKYLLYMHVPFCQRLCPYCSFNRYPFRPEIAAPYFASMRKEMLMLKDLGYDFESVYVGGGTPTIMIDELCETIDLARETFSIKEVSSETNPNHLAPEYLQKMKGRIQRLSVGVQSFDDGLLKQMDRYDKYGSGAEILERIAEATPCFDSLNVDMIYNFPSQTEDILFSDLEKLALCGCTQTTFTPLYVSSATARKIASTLGTVGHDREYRYYRIIEGVLAGGEDPLFENRTSWTYARRDHVEHATQSLLIDEYSNAHEEYPAIGSGSVTHLNGNIYVNTFGLREYNDCIAQGRMSFLRLAGAFATDDADEATLTPKGRYLATVMYRQFLSGMSNLRDQARNALPAQERALLFGDGEA